MKTLLLLIATLAINIVNSQYTQNFEGTVSSLNTNCTTLNGIQITNTPANVIAGSGSLYSTTVTNGNSIMEYITPVLKITSMTLKVSFKYKISNKLSGNATRFIEMGLLNATGTFTSLKKITLDKNTSASVLTFNEEFLLATIGLRKIVIKASGSNGDGNTRLIFDDFFTSASPMYGTGTCNTAPVAVNDNFTGTSGTPFYGNVISNDNEPDGETTIAVISTNSADGVVSLNPDGSFSFIPKVGFTGESTTFSYRIIDNGFNPLTSNVASVTLNFSTVSLLPVKLGSFAATLNQGIVDLKWVTTSELSLSHFSIEKSLDGTNYLSAGKVFASGTTSETKNYSFTDNKLSSAGAEVIYYRLRSLDMDGKSEISLVRTVRLTKGSEQAIKIVTYPNPVTNELRISIPEKWQGQKVVYELINNNGQPAIKLIANISNQNENLQVSTMTAGFYIVRVTCNGQVAHQKIIKR